MENEPSAYIQTEINVPGSAQIANANESMRYSKINIYSEKLIKKKETSTFRSLENILIISVAQPVVFF